MTRREPMPRPAARSPADGVWLAWALVGLAAGVVVLAVTLATLLGAMGASLACALDPACLWRQ